MHWEGVTERTAQVADNRALSSPTACLKMFLTFEAVRRSGNVPFLRLGPSKWRCRSFGLPLKMVVVLRTRFPLTTGGTVRKRDIHLVPVACRPGVFPGLIGIGPPGSRAPAGKLRPHFRGACVQNRALLSVPCPMFVV